jgi:hypothetical protein
MGLEQPCCGGSDFTDPIPLSKRFASFGTVEGCNSRLLSTKGSNNQNQNQNSASNNNNTTATGPSQKLETITIPMNDIMLIGINQTNDNLHQTNITTMSAGYFELSMESQNGCLVLQAFLKANLPKEKVVDGSHQLQQLPRSPSNNTVSTKSFDVEAFTASRMTERLKSESMTEKLQRRIHRLVSSLEESKCYLFICHYYPHHKTGTMLRLAPFANEEKFIVSCVL